MCYYECRKRDNSQKPQCCGHQKADTWKGDPKWYSDAQQSFLLCRLRPLLCSWERLIVVAESSWQAISSISISSRNIIGKPYEKKDPYEGRTGQVIGSGKTRTALLERRTDRRRFASSEKFKNDDWVRLVRAGKTVGSRSGRTARTSLRLVHTSWPCAKYYLFRPSYWINRNIFLP